ncbi:nucleoid-associated protein [Vreelandella sp. GE22]
MEINKVIVHELVKERHQPIENSNYRPLVLDNTHPLVIKLVEGVTKIYGNRYNGAHYGTFVDGDGRGQFPDEFQNYAGKDDPTDLDFIKISHIGMHRLYDKGSVKAASGGYILFSDLVADDVRYFLVVMIKKTPGMRLSEELSPEELEQLDLSKLHQAARINFSRFGEYEDATVEQKRELNYLSFISPVSSRSASGYFITALGCSEGNTSNQATTNLIRGSRKFFKENDSIKHNKDVFMSSLYTYLHEKLESKEPVKLSEVANIASNYVPHDLGDEAQEIVDAFVAVLNSDELAIPVEFPVSKTSLNRHTHVTAKSPNWKFMFDKVALGTDPASEIFYNKDHGSLTITQLPPEVIQQLDQEVSDDGDGQEQDGDDEG